MPEADYFDRASTLLARRTLYITLGLALAGAVVGLFGVLAGVVVHAEAVLVVCSVLFSAGTLVTLLVFRSIALQTIATMATRFFALNLCVGTVIAVCGRGEHLNIFVYLMWFFPLLIFNQLVNKPLIGQRFSKILQIAPFVLILCLLPWLAAVLRLEQQVLLVVFLLSYFCYAATVKLVTRYREKYIVERERAGSLKVESDILESISDCFISLDSSGRLIYMNDAACAELAVDRRAALDRTLADAAPRFLPSAVLAELQEASLRDFASFFEVLNEDSHLWYDLRCFPRSDGMSVYFRNITNSMLSRHKLEQAHTHLREQADLLDKAQDAILVTDLDARIIYWNKGAERLYGWTSEEVVGRMPDDLFRYQVADRQARTDSILRNGEWSGELTQYRSDGCQLIVESRCTLVKDENGEPRSVLAINTDVTARKADEAKIQHLAFYDTLTGLPNRQHLRDRLAQTLASPEGQMKTGVLFYIDLDDFKTLNDTMGHYKGDLLLQQVALRLKSCVRSGDRMRSGDCVARLGGDEFVIMLEGLSEDTQTAGTIADAVANKILAAFVPPFTIGTYEIETAPSIGVTLFSGATDTVDQLLKQTDLAMYQAKTQGGNRICFFDPAMQTKVDTRATLRADLRHALQNNEFQLHYQPQVNSDCVITGSEALLRWFHPVRGRVPPDEFIPLAEQAGLIVELGHWVLETACRQLAAWAGNPSMEHLTVAVNVSVRQFLDPQFVSLVRETLRATGANPHRLKLEITESSTMEKVSDVIAKMGDLKVDGVSFSLDDFGTGYSSLSHLQHLPLDQLKIDRSFVRNVLTHAKDASIARTIIMLGRNLNLSVIAEGVETETQRKFLEAEGCHLYQGFLYSPAIAAAEFEDFVGKSSSQPHRALEAIDYNEFTAAN